MQNGIYLEMSQHRTNAKVDETLAISFPSITTSHSVAKQCVILHMQALGRSTVEHMMFERRCNTTTAAPTISMYTHSRLSMSMPLLF